MGLLDWVFGAAKQRKVPPKDDALARAIIDRVVAATDKRLKALSGYQKTLRDPALATLEHVRRIARDIPGPVEVSTHAWTVNPMIRALFAKASDVPPVFSHNAEVRECFARSMASNCLAMLSLKHVERQVFAPTQEGGAPRNEVARTTVSFGSPRVFAVGTRQTAVRVEIAKRCVDYLALRALARMTADQEHRKELEQERALLKVRLQLAEQGRAGLTDIAASAPAKPMDRAALTAELGANAKALEAFAPTGLMSRFLDILVEVLADPSAHLRLEACTVPLDTMNFRVPDDGTAAVVLKLQELRLPDRPPLAAMVARFPRAELLAVEDALAQAERFLV
jgi:hypothetical protein